jgi:thiamine biosynthesis lipoprotein
LNRVLVPELTAPPTAPAGQFFALSGATMGTSWSVRGFASGELAASLERTIFHTLEHIVGEMSQWHADSDLSRFNALPSGAGMVLPPAFSAVLTTALAVAAETDGAFDPSLGALVDLWGFGARDTAATAPKAIELKAARVAAGWQRLRFDATTRRLVQPGGVRLDLSGIAKGYAVDRLALQLRATGIASFLVEIGGELRGAGVKPDGQPWWVEIERAPGNMAAPILAALCGLSIATSGDYRREAWLDGQRVSHTIDPRTGRPVGSEVAAVTVLHRECMLADAYATALLVMGPQAGLAFAERHNLLVLYSLRGAEGCSELCSAAFERQLSQA